MLSFERQELIKTLSNLPTAQIEQILFVLNVPGDIIPTAPAPKGERVAALLTWAETNGPGLNQLREVLYQVIGQELPNSPQICPYKGLSYFDCNDEDYKYFYGREALTQKLFEQVNRDNFLAIVGASGSGKSSVLRAGLLQRLKDDGGYEIRILVPGEHPQQNLALAFVEEGLERIERAKQQRDVETLIQDGSGGLRCLVQTSDAQKVVLVVDQFEESFTLCQDKAERQAFFATLLDGLEAVGAKLCLILAMRSDFVGKCFEHDYSGLAEKVKSHLEPILPMTQEDLIQAIEAPARQTGMTLEPGLIEALLEDLEQSSGSLPLLQYTLTELWRRQQDNQLKLSVYHQLGGVTGTLKEKADQVYDSLTQAQQQIAKRIFLNLTQLGEGSEDTRRRVTQGSLLSSQDTEIQVADVVKQLADANLVVTDDQGDIAQGQYQATVEVAHEALIRGWPKLRQWLDSSRDDVRFERRLEAAAQYWQDQKRPTGLLWQRPDLDLLRNYYKRLRHQMTALQLEFFQAAVRRETRQKLFLGGAVSTLAVLAAGMTWFGIQAYQFGQRALARQQAAQAEQLLNQTSAIQNEAGALLAVKSLAPLKTWQKESGDVNQALRRALNASRSLATLNHDNDVKAVSFSDDGQRVATASRDNTARVWDAQTGETIATLNHDDEVLAVSFSNDGQRVATASRDNTARVWDAQTGETIATLNHERAVIAVNFSEDGQRVATASRDNTARVWDAQTGERIATLNHERAVIAVNFSEDGQRVVTASWDNTAQVWDTQSGETIATLNHDAAVLAVSFSADGQRVATASRDKTARVWDAQSGETLATLNHDDAVYAVSFSANGQRVATASRDNTARVWNAQTGETLATLNHDAAVLAVSFSANGQQVATASRDNTARVWYAQTGETLATLNHDDEVLAVSFSANGQRVATASSDNTARVWDAQTGGTLATFNHDSVVLAVSLSDDGQRVATASWDTARVWDAQTGKPIATLNHDDAVNAVSFSDDGQRVATASRDKTARVWDAQTGKPIATLNHDNAVMAVSFSDDGQRVATASFDKTARVWDAQTGETIATLNHDDAVWAVSFSDDGQRVATASRDKTTARVWDAQTGETIATLNHDAAVVAVSFSDDGQRVATASLDNTARVWDAQTGKPIATLNHDGLVSAVSFSEDGQRVATASWDTARVWDAQTGETIATLNHDGEVLAVSFSEDGQRVATASFDKTARVWDAQTGETIATLNHDDAVYAVSFSEDGQRVATTSFDKTARVHWLWSRDLAKQVCLRLSRDLTAAEWTNYIQTDLIHYSLTCPELPVHPSVIEAAKQQAETGNVREATALFRRILKLARDAGQTIDLNPATEDVIEDDPEAVANAIHDAATQSTESGQSD